MSRATELNSRLNSLIETDQEEEFCETLLNTERDLLQEIFNPNSGEDNLLVKVINKQKDGLAAFIASILKKKEITLSYNEGQMTHFDAANNLTCKVSKTYLFTRLINAGYNPFDINCLNESDALDYFGYLYEIIDNVTFSSKLSNQSKLLLWMKKVNGSDGFIINVSLFPLESCQIPIPSHMSNCSPQETKSALLNHKLYTLVMCFANVYSKYRSTNFAAAFDGQNTFEISALDVVSICSESEISLEYFKTLPNLCEVILTEAVERGNLDALAALQESVFNPESVANHAERFSEEKAEAEPGGSPRL